MRYIVKDIAYRLNFFVLRLLVLLIFFVALFGMYSKQRNLLFVKYERKQLVKFKFYSIKN